LRKIDRPCDAFNIDYEDVKAKIVQNEGYDMHDFGIFDDRSATLWRKPYVDGAVRELTAGNDKSVDQLRQTVENMILARQDYSVRVQAVSQASSRAYQGFQQRRAVKHDADEEILDELSRLDCHKCHRSRCVSSEHLGVSTPPGRFWTISAGPAATSVIGAVVFPSEHLGAITFAA
jgi:hypothetical protein